VSDVKLLEREVSTPIADEAVAPVYGSLEPGDVVEPPPTPGELSVLELDRTEANPDEDPEPVFRLTKVLEDWIEDGIPLVET